MPKPVTIARYPLSSEIKYAHILKRLVREFKKLALAEIAANGSAIIASADQTYSRSDAIFSASASSGGFMAMLQAMIDRLVGGMTFVLFGAFGQVGQIGEDVNDVHKREWNRQIKQAYGENVNTNPFPEIGLHQARTQRLAVNILSNEPELPNILKAWEQQNIALIKSIPAQLAQQMQSELTAAFVNGTNMKDLAQIVRDRTGVGESRAALIARDQVAKLNGQLSQYRQRAAGLDSYIWRTMHDERVRPTHRVRDGKQYRWSDSEIKPGQEIRCRCIASPVFPELEVQIGKDKAA